MRYSFISAAFLALISSAAAQTNGFDAITSPTQDQNLAAGQSFDIVWQPGTETGDITITLLQGATPQTLEAGPVVAKSISNSAGKYTWTVPSSEFATYGFQITLDSAPTTLQYSFPFHITGGSSSASGSGSGSTSTTTVHLSTGPSYTSSTPSSTAISTSSTPSSTAISTSSTPSSTATSTSTSTVPSSTKTVVSTSSSSASSTVSPTLISSTTLTRVTSSTQTTPTPTSNTPTAPSAVSTNAAAATHVAGSIAMVGGIFMALAL